MARPGRKPIDALTKARRTAAMAIKRRNELHAQIKAERANPPPTQPRKVGKQPVPLLERWKRQKVVAQQTIDALRELEQSAGEKPLSEAALLRWLESNDYSARAGNPGLGKIGALFKEFRRKSDRLNEVIDTPSDEFDRPYNQWLEATGKKGRRPLTRKQCLTILKKEIHNIETQINTLRATLAPGENLKIELDQLRIRRRNLTYHINTHIGIRSTAPNASQQQEEFLKTTKGRRLRQEAAELDTHIEQLTEQIRQDYPDILRPRHPLADVKLERDALLSVIVNLLQHSDPRERERAKRRLKKQAEKLPGLSAELDELLGSS